MQARMCMVRILNITDPAIRSRIKAQRNFPSDPPTDERYLRSRVANDRCLGTHGGPAAATSVGSSNRGAGVLRRMTIATFWPIVAS